MSGWWNHGSDVDIEKEIDAEISVDFDFDTDIDFDKDVDVDIVVESCVDIEGNLTNITFDAEAIGSDSLVEVDLAVLTVEGELSSATGSIIAAA